MACKRLSSRRQMRYTIADKRAVLVKLSHNPTFRETKELSEGSEKRKTLGGQGRNGTFAAAKFCHELVRHMKDQRSDDEVVSGPGMIGWIKTTQSEWQDEYLASSTSAENALSSLMRMCQRFAVRHRFSQRMASYTKKPSDELLITQAEFALSFWEEHSQRDLSEIINVDETAIDANQPPTRFYAEMGGSSKLKYTQKHSDRITAVMAVKANGEKLPIAFIVRGKPGGFIEKTQLCTYPQGLFYYVQENAWMDESVWEKYVKDVLRYYVDGPSVVLLDNFDSHVSDEGENIVLDEAGSMVVPLPVNATSVCQPLDVGVIGPVKKRMKALWLRESHSSKTAMDKRLDMINRTIAA